MADLDADATKDDFVEVALCQVKHSITYDRCQEELLKKSEDNDTQLYGYSCWCTFVCLLFCGRLEGGIAWRGEKVRQVRLLRSYKRHGGKVPREHKQGN